MEANALHDFTATSEDELSFEKGSIVKILKKGPHWHRAEQEGREGLVPNNYVKMLPAPWFSPDVTKDEAERLLHLYPEGGFIMRESQGTSGDFVLSCTAVFDFDGKEANELSFKAGDCIVVLEKSHADWWKGSCNGKVGDFPRTYVKSTEY
ncbi:Protein enhancer of sevenless 2B [Takifugu flavidus]|uniref:Osteoclast-stimulating factor 1 n=1 Tax=Takifugu flavidus TaxID=433684 RepID=A0A5C6N078_9TELE|nr:Protein enhancer of sevenless 2B [Takifugu flavidus]